MRVIAEEAGVSLGGFTPTSRGQGLRPLDDYAPAFVPFFAFFFTFLLTAVSFLRERTQGTMERSTSSIVSPTCRWSCARWRPPCP